MINVKHLATKPFALQALELYEDLLPVAVAAGGPGGDVSCPDCLLACSLTVRTDVASVAQLRSASLVPRFNTLTGG